MAQHLSCLAHSAPLASAPYILADVELRPARLAPSGEFMRNALFHDALETGERPRSRAAVVALTGSGIYTGRWEASPIQRVARPGERAPDVYTYIPYLTSKLCRRGIRWGYVAKIATPVAVGENNC